MIKVFFGDVVDKVICLGIKDGDLVEDLDVVFILDFKGVFCFFLNGFEEGDFGFFCIYDSCDGVFLEY